MTKKLAELLDLAPDPTEPTQEQAEDFIKENFDLIEEVDSAISKIDIALPTVRDLDTADQELDELATLAKTKAEDLIDLGMNTDPRFAGVILQTAGVMLGHSITAKTAKMDKKLRMINLQLQKARLDHQIRKDAKSGVTEEEPIEGQGIVLDRNELLKQILGKQNK
jgi:hypothetical protein